MSQRAAFIFINIYPVIDIAAVAVAVGRKRCRIFLINLYPCRKIGGDRGAARRRWKDERTVRTCYVARDIECPLKEKNTGCRKITKQILASEKGEHLRTIFFGLNFPCHPGLRKGQSTNGVELYA